MSVYDDIQACAKELPSYVGVNILARVATLAMAFGSVATRAGDMVASQKIMPIYHMLISVAAVAVKWAEAVKVEEHAN